MSDVDNILIEEGLIPISYLSTDNKASVNTELINLNTNFTVPRNWGLFSNNKVDWVSHKFSKAKEEEENEEETEGEEKTGVDEEIVAGEGEEEEEEEEGRGARLGVEVEVEEGGGGE